MDYFRQYLLHYLQSDYTEWLKVQTPTVIERLLETRSQQAAETFENERLMGLDILSAQEKAIELLTQGLILPDNTSLKA
jgi:hypothetical protein